MHLNSNDVWYCTCPSVHMYSKNITCTVSLPHVRACISRRGFVGSKRKV